VPHCPQVAESKDGAEVISVDRALRAIRRAEVVVSVIDAAEGITQQDFRLTEMAAAEGRAVVVVVNKWDKVDERVWTEEKYKEDVVAQLRHVSWASVVCTNAVKGECAVQGSACLLCWHCVCKPVCEPCARAAPACT
jgi:GTPase